MKESYNNKEYENMGEDSFSEIKLKETLTKEQIKEKGSKISDSLIYKAFVKSANHLLKKPLTVFEILKKAVERLKQYDSIYEFTDDTKERFMLIVRMLRAYVKGEYTDISKTNAVLSLAAILYFVSPIDLIPDFLIGGLIDDLVILTWVYNNFHHEITQFLEWEEDNQMLRIDITDINQQA